MSQYYRDGAATEPFAKLMAALAETLGMQITETRIRSYAKLLGDLAWPDLLTAFERAANGSHFFPSPSDLRAYLAPSVDDSALLAWSSLDNAAAEFGAYETIRWEDSATGEAMERTFGSWASFCALDDGPQKAIKRQEFLACYRTLLKEADRPREFVSAGALGDVKNDSVWCGIVKKDGRLEATRSTSHTALGPASERRALPDRREVERRSDETGI